MEFAYHYCETLSVDRVFAVDKGLEYADLLGLSPNYIVGDFDTVKHELLENYEKRIAEGMLDSYVEHYPVRKDATDTELALLKAIEEGADKITILGATGTRMDHVLANIGLLLQTAEKQIDCQIVDACNRIRLLAAGEECTILKEEQYGTYLSLIPVTSEVKNLTIKGVLYPLENKCIRQGSSLTVSNQIVEEKAVITAGMGTVLVIESMDE